MADLEKTVKIIFEGDDSILQKSVDNIAGKFNELGTSFNPAIETLDNVAGSILKIDAALAALVAGGLVMAVKKAADFDKSFDSISMRIKGTTGSIEKFRGEVLTYGQDSTKSLLDINAAVSQAIQKGLSYQDALKMVSDAEKLSVAGKGDLKSSTELLTTVMNSYGASASEAGRYSDIFMAAIQQGAGTIPDLASGLGKVAGLAAAAGVPIETVTAAIAALGAQGIPTDTAIQGITRTIANLLDPSKEAKELAAKLGLQFDATALKTQGLETVLKNAGSATKGNAEQMKTLFGSVRGLTVAVDLAVDSHGKFKSALDAVRNSAGTTHEIWKREKDDLDMVTQNIKNNIDAVLIDVGLRLLPSVSELGMKMSDVFKGIKIGVDGGSLDPLFNVLEKADKELSAWIEQVAKAVPDAFKKVNWSKLTESLESFGLSIKQVLGGEDINADKLAAGIQSIVDTLASLIDITKGIGEGLTPFALAITSIVEGFNKLSPDTKTNLGDVLGIAMGFKVFGPVWGSIMLGMAADSESSAKIINFAFNAIDNGVNALKVAVLSLAVVFASASQDMAKLLNHVPGYDASDDIKRTGERVKILSSELQDAETKYDKSSKKLLEGGSAAKQFGDSAAAAAEKTRDLKKELAGIPDKKDTTISVKTDEQSFKDSENTIYSKFSGTTFKITTNVDGSSTIEALKSLGAAIPAEKKVEIKPDITQTAMAEIKEKSAILQKAVEWKAKIDIEQIQAATKVMEAAFKSVDATIADTGKTVTDLTSTYASVLKEGKGGSSFIEQQIREENKRRDEALTMQKNLVEAQVDNLKARTDAMKNGQAMIQIDGKGLQPQLEAFMFEVLKAIQVRANAEGAQFLVGI